MSSRHRTIDLGINVDHVATLRQARGTTYPDPLYAALLAEQSGADSITIHLREDRRHIQDRDVHIMRGALQTRMNLEMACTETMIALAESIKPQDVCLVPEKRAELTTEGGLDVLGNFDVIKLATHRLTAAGVRVSLFIDPEPKQLDAAAKLGAPVVELHTGAYADAHGAQQARELTRLQQAAQHADNLGLIVNAGHGLHYHNVHAIAAIAEIVELNIGHAIIARAVFDGLANAVREMKRLMLEGAERIVIHGIGTDIVKLERFEQMYQRHGERLVKHLLLPAERELFQQSKRPARFLAMHWAAKEAVVKAMGTGFADGMWIRDTGYLPNKAGKPEIIWSEDARVICQQLGIGTGHLTLSDEEGLIVAVAVLMKVANVSN